MAKTDLVPWPLHGVIFWILSCITHPRVYTNNVLLDQYDAS